MMSIRNHIFTQKGCALGAFLSPSCREHEIESRDRKEVLMEIVWPTPRFCAAETFRKISRSHWTDGKNTPSPHSWRKKSTDSPSLQRLCPIWTTKIHLHPPKNHKNRSHKEKGILYFTCAALCLCRDVLGDPIGDFGEGTKGGQSTKVVKREKHMLIFTPIFGGNDAEFDKYMFVLKKLKRFNHQLEKKYCRGWNCFVWRSKKVMIECCSQKNCL